MVSRIDNSLTRSVSLLTVIVIMSTVGCSKGKLNSKSPDSQEIQYRTISVEDYEDKVAGGWLGQATGVLWGSIHRK